MNSAIFPGETRLNYVRFPFYYFPNCCRRRLPHVAEKVIKDREFFLRERDAKINEITVLAEITTWEVLVVLVNIGETKIMLMTLDNIVFSLLLVIIIININ